MKYLDNSLSRQFNLIYNYGDKKLKGKVKEIKYYYYSLIVPKKLKNENNTYEKDNYILSLFEKHIIIIANQNIPLFCICESIQILLFPFRWLHLYVPNLPYDQIGY